MRQAGYLVFDDSKSVLIVFAKETEKEGYIVAREIGYGSYRSEVDDILNKLSETIDLSDTRYIIDEDKHSKKFN